MKENDEETLHPVYSGKRFKRLVRRYLRAPLHRFAVIAPPSLKSVCATELKDMGLSGLHESDAGVEFVGKWSECYRANLWSATGSRVLWRVAEFRAGALEELHNRLTALRWELFINPAIPLRVDVFLGRGRITDRNLAEKAVRQAVMRRIRCADLDPGGLRCERKRDRDRECQRLLIRLERNRCLASLDTSGKRLHLRGYRLQHTGAPMRESLAAAVLRKIGWRGDRPLVDAMTGSGTVAIEAALAARRIPPGSERSFTFQKWPFFFANAWNFLLKEARRGILERCPVEIVAVDRNADALRVARANAARAGVVGDINWMEADFLQWGPSLAGRPPGVLIVDPPYGKRLQGGGGVFYRDLGRVLKQYFRGWQVAVLAPDPGLLSRLGLGTIRLWRVQHGGLPVSVAITRVR